ncbi:MAG: ABC transporter substrate-binding protein [Pseudomonadota bacterium]
MKPLLLLSAAGLAFAFSAAPVMAENKSVAITQIVEHPALDAARKGVQDALAADGFTVGDTLDWTYESAQGNGATAAQIANKFVGEEPDVIVAIATPSAQAVVAKTSDIPVVFSAVTDPIAAKLVSQAEKPGGNVTGVSDLTPVGLHLSMIDDAVGGVEKIGVIYNPGEANSQVLVDLAKSEAAQLGYEIVEAGAPRSADVKAAAESLVGKVDAIYVPTDNTVVSAFESVVRVGEQAKLPVFAGDTDSVSRGAIAALGFDYYQVGYKTGEVVARILKGENPGDIDVQYASLGMMSLVVNKEAAEKMGVELPEEFLAKAQ